MERIDEWAMAHIVAMTFDKNEILKAENELVALDINFKRNDVPNYKQGADAYRIFVFGKDIFKLDQFKKKYLLD